MPAPTASVPPTAPARSPAPAPQRRTAQRAPLAVAALVATTWAALVSLVPVVATVMLVHLTDGTRATPGRLWQVGLAGWLLAHGVPLGTGLGRFSLAPLAITAVAAWRLVRAGVHTSRVINGRRRPSPRSALLAAAAVGVTYGVLGAVAAGLASGSMVRVPVLQAGLTLTVFGLIAGGTGVGYQAGLLDALAAGTPPVLRDAVRTGVVGALLVLGAGAAAAGTSIAVAGREASQIAADYHTGVAGQAGLILLTLVYAPNLAAWGASYLVGPGFSVGVATVVSAGSVVLGGVPAVPALAGLPSRPLAGWGSVLLGVPLAAGMTAGWLLARRRLREAGGPPAGRRGPGQRPVAAPGPARTPAGVIGAVVARLDADWAQLVAAALLAGPVAGVLLAISGVASSGSLGAGQLREIGPAVLPTAAVGAGLIAAGALVAAAATRWLMVTREPG